MSEQQWEEVKIEDVQPGDVARCNGREFPVEGSAFSDWYVRLEANYAPINLNPIFEKLGFTFWRKVKREPRTFCGFVTVLRRPLLYGSGSIPCAQVLMPDGWEHGTPVRITEILDGEDGA